MLSTIRSHAVASARILYDKGTECFYKSGKTTTDNRMFAPVGFFQQLTSFFSPPTKIIDNIWLGSAYNAANYNSLKAYNIDIIINITSEMSNHYPTDFEYKQYCINDNDTAEIAKPLEEVYNIIKENPTKNILIHCFMGASRSVSAVIYYLMRDHNMSLESAVLFIKDRRNIVNPNLRFIDTLREIPTTTSATLSTQSPTIN